MLVQPGPHCPNIGSMRTKALLPKTKACPIDKEGSFCKTDLCAAQWFTNC